MPRSMLRALLLALAIALIASACGDDDGDPGAGDTTEETQAASGDLEAFCETIIEAEAAVIAASGGPGSGPASEPVDPAPLLDDALAQAPEEISEQVTQVVEIVRGALESRDPSAFESEEFRTTEEEVDRFVVENCGNETVTVSAIEYEFQGLPETLPSGLISFDFTNEGEEVHEMSIVRILDEDIALQELLQMPQKKADKLIEFAGGSFAPPGEGDAETIELTPGRYGVVCFIPVGATSLEALDTAEGPPHAFEGMVAELTVE